MLTTFARTSAGGSAGSGRSHGSLPYCSPHHGSTCVPHARLGTPAVGSFHFFLALPMMYGLQRPFGGSFSSMYMPMWVIASYQPWSLFS